MRAMRFSLACLAGLLLVACGGSTDTDLFSTPPASNNQNPDASVTNKDASSTPDSSEPGPDASIADTSMPDTNMPDTNPPGISIACGNSTCSNPPDVCCRSGGGGQYSYACVNDPNTNCANQGDVPIACTKEADCPNQGDICCISLNNQNQPSDVSCQPQNQCFGGVACDPKAPNHCPNGLSCQISTLTLPGYYICK